MRKTEGEIKGESEKKKKEEKLKKEDERRKRKLMGRGRDHEAEELEEVEDK